MKNIYYILFGIVVVILLLYFTGVFKDKKLSVITGGGNAADENERLKFENMYPAIEKWVASQQNKDLKQN